MSIIDIAEYINSSPGIGWWWRHNAESARLAQDCDRRLCPAPCKDRAFVQEESPAQETCRMLWASASGSGITRPKQAGVDGIPFLWRQNGRTPLHH